MNRQWLGDSSYVCFWVDIHQHCQIFFAWIHFIWELSFSGTPSAQALIHRCKEFVKRQLVKLSTKLREKSNKPRKWLKLNNNGFHDSENICDIWSTTEIWASSIVSIDFDGWKSKCKSCMETIGSCEIDYKIHRIRLYWN